MHKLLLLLFTASLLTQQAYAQLIPERRNSISVNYAISSSIIPNGNLIGAASLEGLTHTVGISYYRDLSYAFGFETGLRYTMLNMSSSGINGSGQSFDRKFNDGYITLPILVEYNFLRYLFAQLGPTVSMQVNKNEYMNQSGIGLWGAFGGKINSKNMTFKAYPYYHSQSVIAFSKTYGNQSLQNVGFNIGIGYTF